MARFDRNIPQNSDSTISVLMPSGALDIFEKFRKDKNLLTLSYFGGEYAFRENAELTLLIKALSLGGMPNKVKFVPFVMSGHQRYFEALASGAAATIGETVWLNDLVGMREQVYITQALVRDGEFYVGLYTHPNNMKALSARTLDDIRKLSIVSNVNWAPDKTAIEKIGFKYVYHTSSYTSMLKMVKAQRVDVTLSALSSSDNYEHPWGEGILIPIPNIKVYIEGSRHWAVSKRHPMGEQIYAALEIGLSELRKTGVIERAYEESGFFHQGIQDWKVIGRDDSIDN